MQNKVGKLYVSFALVLLGVVMIALFPSAANPKSLLGIGLFFTGNGIGWWLRGIADDE